MGGDGLPALVPDRPGAEHRVELRLARRRRRRVLGARAHAHSVEAALHVALDRGRGLDAEMIQDGGHAVVRGGGLVPYLTPSCVGRWPGFEARVGGDAVEL